VQRCPDITLATTLLAWQPITPLADGLARTIAYFDKLLSQRSQSSVDFVAPVAV